MSAELTAAERMLLTWLSAADFSQYGECHGPALDKLIECGLAQVHGPGEHQGSFIARDPDGTRGMLFRAVSLTEAGRSEIKRTA
jgi:hypothetical protein